MVPDSLSANVAKEEKRHDLSEERCPGVFDEFSWAFVGIFVDPGVLIQFGETKFR